MQIQVMVIILYFDRFTCAFIYNQQLCFQLSHTRVYTEAWYVIYRDGGSIPKEIDLYIWIGTTTYRHMKINQLSNIPNIRSWVYLGSWKASQEQIWFIIFKFYSSIRYSLHDIDVMIYISLEFRSICREMNWKISHFSDPWLMHITFIYRAIQFGF